MVVRDILVNESRKVRVGSYDKYVDVYIIAGIQIALAIPKSYTTGAPAVYVAGNLSKQDREKVADYLFPLIGEGVNTSHVTLNKLTAHLAQQPEKWQPLFSIKKSRQDATVHKLQKAMADFEAALENLEVNPPGDFPVRPRMAMGGSSAQVGTSLTAEEWQRELEAVYAKRGLPVDQGNHPQVIADIVKLMADTGMVRE